MRLVLKYDYEGRNLYMKNDVFVQKTTNFIINSMTKKKFFIKNYNDCKYVLKNKGDDKLISRICKEQNVNKDDLIKKCRKDIITYRVLISKKLSSMDKNNIAILLDNEDNLKDFIKCIENERKKV